jgi:hypothetical protein
MMLYTYPFLINQKYFPYCRTEQQKNSCLAEMNDMRGAVEEMNMEKVKYYFELGLKQKLLIKVF